MDITGLDSRIEPGFSSAARLPENDCVPGEGPHRALRKYVFICLSGFEDIWLRLFH